MAPSSTPSVDHLEQTWRSISELCAELSEDEWKRPTGCPGWSVQDQLSHLIDYEARALGRPAPEGEAAAGPHLRNALGETNELAVEARRSLPGVAVLDEFREVTAERLAQIRALTPDDLAQEVETPAGKGTVADSLTLRVMDTWSHEQDIRRALGRPGHVSGPAAEEAVGYFLQFLPLVVGKRAAPPDGTVVLFEIGEVSRCVIEVVDGRARPAANEAGEPTVRLAMPVTTFAALVGGRSDVPDDVVVAGDEELGRRILGVLGFMP